MENTYAFVLREGALNDDELLVTRKGYAFKGGYKYAVRYWTYANSWGNHEHVFYAKTAENAVKRYEKICGKLDEDERNLVLDAVSNTIMD